MTRHPGAEWIPAAFLVPAVIIRAAVAVIEAACEVWDDEDEEATEEPWTDCGCGVRGCVWGHGA